MQIESTTLEGRIVRLSPLTLDHHSALCEVGLDEELWKFSPFPIRNSSEMLSFIKDALESQAKGLALPFVTIEESTNTIVGSTRYGNIDATNLHVEIGWTWIARPWQRTAVNTEAKYLMLRHAFETLGCKRVEFKTDSLNERSRNAILRLGAQQEGIFRNHMVTSTDRMRHSVFFSIIDSEWLEVKAGLEGKLSRTNLPIN